MVSVAVQGVYRETGQAPMGVGRAVASGDGRWSGAARVRGAILLWEEGGCCCGTREGTRWCCCCAWSGGCEERGWVRVHGVHSRKFGIPGTV